MGIDADAAVPREVLRCRQAAVFFDAADELRSELRDLLRVLPERANVDDRVQGVVIHISVGCEYPMNAGSTGFERSHFSGCVCEFRIARCTNRHCRGKVRSFVESHAGTAFKIGADQERNLSMTL